MWQEWTASKRPLSSATFSMRAWMSWCARQAGAGRGDALVGLDGGEMRARRGVQEGAREAAAIGADVENREILREIAVAAQRLERDLGAEALAVADIAPVGAAGNRGGRARGAVHARQALQQAAGTAQMDRQSARRAFRLVDGIERCPVAQLAGVGHGAPVQRNNPVTIFGASWLIFHHILGKFCIAEALHHRRRDGLEAVALGLGEQAVFRPV
ncbi:MAG: hypothetical protein WDM81_13050 [Rhizomicrobium sp.]